MRVRHPRAGGDPMHRKKSGPGPETQRTRDDEAYTLNDSPQPQRSFSFGLLNLKPSFKPSRT